MPTNYPGSLDALTNPTPTDPLASSSVPHATQHTSLNDGMEAVQAKLGVGVSVPAIGTVLATATDGRTLWTSSPSVKGPYPWADVEAYGAYPSASGPTNRAAIQAAIDAVLAAGGGLVFVPRSYAISGGPLTVSAGTSGVNDVGLSIVGGNMNYSKIEQLDAGQDLISTGTNVYLYSADHFTLRDIHLKGGRHVVHLNNTQYPDLQRVWIEG